MVNGTTRNLHSGRSGNVLSLVRRLPRELQIQVFNQYRRGIRRRSAQRRATHLSGIRQGAQRMQYRRAWRVQRRRNRLSLRR